MSGQAAVILAHTDPVHLHRLVRALPDIPVVVHCDAKTPPATYDAITDRMPSRVRFSRRISTSLASWSLVEAEIEGLRTVLATTSARHIIVASGSDYPLVSMAEIDRTLAGWADRSILWNVPIPYENWSTPRNADGGLWRFSHRFLTYRNNVVYVHAIPLRWPFTRDIPAGLELRAASQWKIYARSHAELLVRIVDENPTLMSFWRTTLVPDESFAASVLGSPAFAGADPLPFSTANAWYTHWHGGNADHPDWLGTDDLERLREARAAAAGSNPAGSNPSGPPAGPTEPRCGALFARKFSTSTSSHLLNRIDTELRG